MSMADRPHHYHAAQIEDALDRLAEFGPRARLVAGATDFLSPERQREEAPARPDLIIDISRIPGLDRVVEDEQTLRVGALVTHTEILRSAPIVQHALPVAQASLDLGTPQVRNRGTLAGSIASAHDHADPVTALLALGASVLLASKIGERRVAVADLGRGERIGAQELIREVTIPKLGPGRRALFAKHQRRAGVGVATVNLAAVLRVGDRTNAEATLVAGGCGPREVASAVLPALSLDDAAIGDAAHRFAGQTLPADDLHASAAYRRAMIEVLVRRALRALRDGEERLRWPTRPVALWGPSVGVGIDAGDTSRTHDAETPIAAVVDGGLRSAPAGPHRTLLEWLREGLGVTACKNGCEEGVCGACTVLLDGVAVASCLVPAPRAHGTTVTTAAGLLEGGEPCPLQTAFVEEGAVQCGYCTPGTLVALVALLEDTPDPSVEEVEAALAGTLCRCTGYHSIRRAVRRAVGGRHDRRV